ncbi:MAG: acetylxylan esterase [Bryobacterales bacterium]|nr:acetylxylan esterase [Bryobacterales bacterium]
MRGSLFQSVVPLLVAVSTLYAADEFAEERQLVLGLGNLTAAPARFAAEGFAKDERIEAIFFEGLPWKGSATRVFAWLGLPEDGGAKVPGIVLVHGGGGTAFREWVERWTGRGYAAISIAVEGQTDEAEEVPPRARRSWKRHAWAGPRREGIYADSSEPLRDQWMYHAVADTVLANSLLRSLPRVDADRVGLMGISWGGVITSTAIGIDQRFAFAIPTYGCGHLFDSANRWGEALGDNRLYREVWDPMVRIDRVLAPVLWLSWPGEGAFPLDCQAACYRAAPGRRMVSLIPGMGHSHRAGWTPPDSYAFADSVVRSGEPWLTLTESNLSNGTVRVQMTAAKHLDSASLVWTGDLGFTGSREWAQSPAELTRNGGTWLVTAALPDIATAWFVNVRSGELTASSDYEQIR